MHNRHGAAIGQKLPVAEPTEVCRKSILMQSNDIALAFSGGGIRALAFHSGVLRYLAEQGQLERVSHLSTVSGASLLIGLVFHRSEMTWPSSDTYLTRTAPMIRDLITSQDLQSSAIRRLAFQPLNWRYAFSRANVIAQAIKEIWGIDQCLADLPSSPEWTINGTTAETGKRFRFKLSQLGDYELGYADASNFPLATAMATSAAFPVGIGPLAIDVRKYSWTKRPYWGASNEEAKPISAPYPTLHIYDGGVYDNLGLEALFDLSRNEAQGAYRIVASDAGAPLTSGFNFWGLSPFRIKRLLDIVTDQTRALRVRSFVQFLRGEHCGAYLRIGTVPGQLFAKSPRLVSDSQSWLSDTEIELARTVPTNLHSLEPEMFDLVERHGYETARAVQLAYPYLPGDQQGKVA